MQMLRELHTTRMRLLYITTHSPHSFPITTPLLFNKTNTTRAPADKSAPRWQAYVCPSGALDEPAYSPSLYDGKPSAGGPGQTRDKQSCKHKAITLARIKTVYHLVRNYCLLLGLSMYVLRVGLCTRCPLSWPPSLLAGYGSLIVRCVDSISVVPAVL